MAWVMGNKGEHPGIVAYSLVASFIIAWSTHSGSISRTSRSSCRRSSGTLSIATTPTIATFTTFAGESTASVSAFVSASLNKCMLAAMAVAATVLGKVYAPPWAIYSLVIAGNVQRDIWHMTHNTTCHRRSWACYISCGMRSLYVLSCIFAYMFIFLRICAYIIYMQSVTQHRRLLDIVGYSTSSATRHRRLLNIVGYSTSSMTQHRQPCPQSK
jgi:hypothetical protein